MLLVLAGGAAGFAWWGYRQIERTLPDNWSALLDYSPSRASRVYDANGELIGEFFLEKRIVVPYEKIPRHVRLAFVAAEDNRFFEHHGVDPLGILRAAIANARAGHVVQGGSTITQQVAKLLIVGNERKMIRKLKEAILAEKIERRLSKDQILSLYLNHVYLGHGAYGVQAAAEIYFGKDVGQLTVAEAAMIGGLPKAPSEDSPFRSFARAKARQRYVIDQMVANGFITADEGRRAHEEPIAIISRDSPLNHVAAPYFVEFVRKYVQQRYSGQIYDQGLRIETTLDMRMQRAAEQAVRQGLEALDQRLGFRGPVAHLDDAAARERFIARGPQPYVATPTTDANPGGTDEAELRKLRQEAARSGSIGGALVPNQAYLGLVEQAVGKPAEARKLRVRVGAERLSLEARDAGRVERWLGRRGNHLGPGDLLPVKLVTVERKQRLHGRAVTEQVREVVLAQQPDVQAALVAVDPATGWLRAMVGGYDYALSQFNRAVQAKRQAGSSIKPYIYAAAMEKGYTELSIVDDAPVFVKTVAGVWSPKNYEGKFLGPVTLRTALAKSLNTVSVRLVESVGLDRTIEMMRRFGLTSPIVRHPSIALGVPELSPMEAAYAQATFPAMGLEVEPVFVTRVLDGDGKVLEEHATPTERKRRIPADLAYVMVDMMKNVVQNGTGKQALALGRPAGGKTGTSNDYKDAWFVGYTADLLAVTWVGRDNFKSIGHNATGGQVALPIWLDFMQHAHPDTSVRDFTPPPGVYFARALPATGQPAAPGTLGSVLIPFRRGTLPPQFQKGTTDAQFSDDKF